MHMISTMDFFFISCVKCHSVTEGAVGAAWQITPLLHWRDLTIWINMRGAFPFHLLAEVFRATLSGVTLSRALPRASSSCSHSSLANTCHCQSHADNTQMILSFGLIKSLGLFELQSLQQIIAALRFLPGRRLRDKEGLLLYEGFGGCFLKPCSPVVHISKMNITLESRAGCLYSN